jgi:hypothetical protein
MVQKIISGGQTGADQAALDAAMELGFPYGGWIPMGRKTEAGPLSAKYHQMLEMPTASYLARIEQNVIDSDGTLLLSHGQLTGAPVLTPKFAMKHKKPLKHIDLEEFCGLAAAHLVIAWIDQEGIEVLNVAGSRASKDHGIYKDTKEVITGVIKLSKLSDVLPYCSPDLPVPSTVDEAVANLASCLSLKGKVQLAGLSENEVFYMLPSMGSHVKTKFLLWGSNKELMKSCADRSGEEDLNEDFACFVILQALWRHLKDSHKLRPVK